jgi:glucans biosynthesis protein
MNRRDFLQLAGSLPLAVMANARSGLAQRVAGKSIASVEASQTARHGAAGEASPSGSGAEGFLDWLVGRAERLARHPYAPPREETDDVLSEIGYDRYRDIHFKREAALWRNTSAPFQVEFLHTGYLFNDSVRMYVLNKGAARECRYDPSMFYFGPLMQAHQEARGAAGFSGFRLLSRLNSPAYYNEWAVFQGASYFRATGRGQVYGLSARGLTVNCGQPGGEEFPAFRAFWIQRPVPGDETAVVYALLNGESVTGAYKFLLTPGQSSVIEVDCTLFCRRPLVHVGLAPLTSMFYFGPNQHGRFDDYRPEVHDSDGLAIWNGAGEWLWRPLLNPRKLQFSAFSDQNPKGFGLLQRARSFSQYQDLEARYDQRPSAWVEPLGEWGKGSVDLLELPTSNETNDNIVAFWRPEKGFAPGQEYRYRYRIHWRRSAPADNNLAWVSAVRTGKSRRPRALLIVADFLGTRSLTEGQVTVDLRASAGRVADIVLRPNSVTGGFRLSFDFDPCGCRLADIRAALMCNGARVSEVWTHRWRA